MTAWRRDPVLTGLPLSEVALRAQLVSHFLLSIELQVQRPTIWAEVGNCPEVKET